METVTYDRWLLLLLCRLRCHYVTIYLMQTAVKMILLRTHTTYLLNYAVLNNYFCILNCEHHFITV